MQLKLTCKLLYLRSWVYIDIHRNPEIGCNPVEAALFRRRTSFPASRLRTFAQGPQTNGSAHPAPGKTRKCRHCHRCKGPGKISTGLVPARRSFGEGASASFVRALVAPLTPPRPPHPAPCVCEEWRSARGTGCEKL